MDAATCTVRLPACCKAPDRVVRPMAGMLIEHSECPLLCLTILQCDGSLRLQIEAVGHATWPKVDLWTAVIPDLHDIGEGVGSSKDTKLCNYHLLAQVAISPVSSGYCTIFSKFWVQP